MGFLIPEFVINEEREMKNWFAKIVKSIKDSRKIHVLLARKAVVVCMVILMLMILAAIFAPFVAPYDPNTQDLKSILHGASSEHILGTDGLGRDILSRLIYGGRISFFVGFVSIFIAGSIGMILGLIAGMSGGLVDTIVMRVMDAMMSIPMIISRFILRQYSW